jgi:cell division protein FtsB
VKILGGILAALIVLIQYPLWLGKGGWLRVWEVDRQLDGQRARNLELQVRNRSLEAEVLDLKLGVDALEERARYELGMIKSDEVFFQIVEKGGAQAPIAPLPAVGR